jgi:hypothetical protein
MMRVPVAVALGRLVKSENIDPGGYIMGSSLCIIEFPDKIVL